MSRGTEGIPVGVLKSLSTHRKEIKGLIRGVVDFKEVNQDPTIVEGALCCIVSNVKPVIDAISQACHDPILADVWHMSSSSSGNQGSDLETLEKVARDALADGVKEENKDQEFFNSILETLSIGLYFAEQYDNMHAKDFKAISHISRVLLEEYKPTEKPIHDLSSASVRTPALGKTEHTAFFNIYSGSNYSENPNSPRGGSRIPELEHDYYTRQMASESSNLMPAVPEPRKKTLGVDSRFTAAEIQNLRFTQDMEVPITEIALSPHSHWKTGDDTTIQTSKLDANLPLENLCPIKVAWGQRSSETSTRESDVAASCDDRMATAISAKVTADGTRILHRETIEKYNPARETVQIRNPSASRETVQISGPEEKKVKRKLTKSNYKPVVEEPVVTIPNAEEIISRALAGDKKSQMLCKANKELLQMIRFRKGSGKGKKRTEEGRATAP